MTTERRFLATKRASIGLETRADGKQVFVGYGAVYYNSADPGSEYDLFGDGEYLERIEPGAFNRAIAEKDDARGLFNHDSNNLLGRVSSGTMRLTADTQGLRYEIDYDADDQDHQRVAAKIRRGDLTGSSFAFRVRKVTWIEEEEVSIRMIQDVELFDTGPVTYPAYDSTTAGVRAEDGLAEVRSELDAWQDSVSSEDKIVNKHFRGKEELAYRKRKLAASLL